MKKIILYLSIVFTSTSLIAQEHIDLITDFACACIDKKELNEKDQQALQMELGLCILEGLSKVDQNIIDSLNLDMTDQNGMYKLGESIGIRMASRCPGTLMKVMSSADLDFETGDFSEIVTNEIQGKISKVEMNELTIISLETHDGSILKLLWLRPFEGAESFIKNPKSLVNKKVEISFEEIEIFTPSLKSYLNRKEIVSLKVVE